MPETRDQASMPPRTRKRLILVTAGAIGVAALLFLNYADRDPARPADLASLVSRGDAKGFNVLLVTLDTTRQDRLGCYGYRQAQTPAIDALARRGVRFDHAVASSPMTLPSHATLLTGLAPPRHGVRGNGLYHLAEAHSTLAETLRDHGYDTAAFIACFVLEKRFGLDQGFDVYDFEVSEDGYSAQDPNMNERQADEVTDAAIRWLDDRMISKPKRPFFAWVHYFDPHMPYESPLALQTRDWAARPYDAEIAFMDREFGRLLAELERHGLKDQTLIVVVADHGEGLGDHGEETHGFFIYESTVRVPMLLSNPVLFDDTYRVDDRVVGLIDVRPTVEALLGIDSNAPLDGENLLAPDTDPDRAVYMETLFGFHGAGWSPLYGLRRHGDKYIRAPRPEYYDLQSDPHELENLHDAKPAGLAALRERFHELSAAWGTGADATTAERDMTPEETQRLLSLGYIHSDLDPASRALADPKDMLPIFDLVLDGLKLHQQGRSAEAVQRLEEALEANETMTPAQIMLASIYLELDRPKDAINLLRRAIASNPQISAYLMLAQTLLGQEAYAEAAEILDAAEAMSPDDGRIWIVRGDWLAGQGKLEEAVEHYRKAIKVDEHRVGIPAREKILQLTAGRRSTSNAHPDPRE